MRIKPTGYRILVKPHPIEEVTKGGIIIPTQDRGAEEAAQTSGDFVAAGPYAWRAFDKDEYGRPNGKPWANEGDTVIYAKFAGITVTDPDTGEDYKLLSDDDIVAIIESA